MKPQDGIRQVLKKFKPILKDRFKVKQIGIFGSYARGEESAESDIDILVEFDQNHMPGLMDIAGMEIELADKLGKKVDLRTPAELSRYFRDDVLGKARVEYAI